jgi:hypothetical protein
VTERPLSLPVLLYLSVEVELVQLGYRDIATRALLRNFPRSGPYDHGSLYEPDSRLNKPLDAMERVVIHRIKRRVA